jgi:quinol monooxygenase YgiN
MIPRRSFLKLTATAVASSQASAVAGASDFFHIAIFRFAKENVDDAMAAFRALAAASRQESGNFSYEIYRGIENELEFCVLEHWASPEALATHERTEAFINFRQGVLVKHATLHDAVTGRPFDQSTTGETRLAHYLTVRDRKRRPSQPIIRFRSHRVGRQFAPPSSISAHSSLKLSRLRFRMAK